MVHGWILFVVESLDLVLDVIQVLRVEERVALDGLRCAAVTTTVSEPLVAIGLLLGGVFDGQFVVERGYVSVPRKERFWKFCKDSIWPLVGTGRCRCG